MKITLITLGTRGDVQPFLALAKALIARGHNVKLAAPDNFKDWVESHGVTFHAIGVDMEAFLQSDEIREVLSGNWFGLRKIWHSKIIPMFENTIHACWDAGKDADVLVYHPKAYAAVDVAEATGATSIVAAPIPMFPTREFPSIIFTKNYGGVLNKASWLMFNGSRFVYAKVLNKFRQEVLGLGKGKIFAPIGWTPNGMAMRLCAVSPSVIPRPKDWDDGIHMTGYWFFDENKDWEPSGELASFLESGEPPIYIGFGSMTTKNPEAFTKTIIEAVKKSGKRAILSLGWGGMEAVSVPPEVFIIQSAPHEQLFKYVSAVVHHGGAGTTAAGLRAGKPTLICPQSVDQPFWGKRVELLGCGPRALPIKDITVDGLAERLCELCGRSEYVENARKVSEGIEREDGVGEAVRLIEGERS